MGNTATWNISATMTFLQFSQDLGRLDATRRKQDKGMIRQICHLLDETLVVLGKRGNNCLRAFFPNLLCDLWQAFCKKTDGIRFFMRVILSILDHLK